MPTPRLFAIALSSICLLHLATVSANSQQRPDTRTFYCDDARAFVKQNGAVVMSTGRFTYERIVAGRAFCEFDEDTFTLFAPTRDRRKCPVGKRCVPNIRIGNN